MPLRFYVHVYLQFLAVYLIASWPVVAILYLKMGTTHFSSFIGLTLTTVIFLLAEKLYLKPELRKARAAFIKSLRSED